MDVANSSSHAKTCILTAASLGRLHYSSPPFFVVLLYCFQHVSVSRQRLMAEEVVVVARHGALHAGRPCMFMTELSVIHEMDRLLKQKAEFDRGASLDGLASDSVSPHDNGSYQQNHVDIAHYRNELTSLGTQEAAGLAAAARVVVQAALNATPSVSSECQDLLLGLLTRINAEIANPQVASSLYLEAQSVAPSPASATSSPLSAVQVAATAPISGASSSVSALVSSPEDTSSPDSILDTVTVHPDEPLQVLAARARSWQPRAPGGAMTEDEMRTFAVGKLGLTVVALKDGGAVFQVKLDAHTPVAVFKALLNGAYVKGTTTNRFEPTESAEAWALAQLVSEYRGCVAPAVSSNRVKRQLNCSSPEL